MVFSDAHDAGFFKADTNSNPTFLNSAEGFLLHVRPALFYPHLLKLDNSSPGPGQLLSFPDPSTHHA